MSLPEVCVCYLIRESNGGGTTDGESAKNGGRGGAQVLLGRKKFGLGEGRLVGPGGKLEPGETPAEAIVREVFEEVGLVVAPDDLELMGDLTYPFPHRTAWSQRSWVFIARRWSGEPVESDELEPVWVDVESIPLEKMWDDAKYWLPATLRGAPVHNTFTFGSDGRTVESSDHPDFAPAATGGC